MRTARALRAGNSSRDFASVVYCLNGAAVRADLTNSRYASCQDGGAAAPYPPGYAPPSVARRATGARLAGRGRHRGRDLFLRDSTLARESPGGIAELPNPDRYSAVASCGACGALRRGMDDQILDYAFPGTVFDPEIIQVLASALTTPAVAAIRQFQILPHGDKGISFGDQHLSQHAASAVTCSSLRGSSRASG